MATVPPEFPQQLAKLIGKETLFQATVRRLSGKNFSSPVVVTSDQFKCMGALQLADVDVGDSTFLIEPEPRNTAPAVLAAALWLLESGNDPVLLIAPTNHVIPAEESFRGAVAAALPDALAGNLVAFGILPTRPETGYGYMELAEGCDLSAIVPQALRRFVEKPGREKASEMLAGGNCLWNAGVFLFKASAVLSAFECHARDMVAPVLQSVRQARQTSNVTELAAEP